MEEPPKITLPNPYEDAGFLNRLLFCWMTPFFKKGYSKNLDVDDLYVCPRVEKSEKLGDKLQKEWDKELLKLREKKTPSLFKAIFRTFGLYYMLHACSVGIAECGIRVLQPICLGWIVDYFSASDEMKEDLQLKAIIAAATICVSSIVFIFLIHPYFFNMQRYGMKVRIACCNLLYKKSLCLSQRALGETTVGQMVNLLSNDVNRFDWSFIYVPFLVFGPLQTAIIIGVLWTHLSYYCLAGISILAIYIPFQVFMGQRFSKLRAKTALRTDERVRLMNEIVNGMRVIKMYTWEKPFAMLVNYARKMEVKIIRRTAILRGINMALFFVSSKTILFLCILAFVLTSNKLTPTIVFVSMSLLNNLRLTMTLYFPYGMSQGAEALISMRRLQKFLLLEEQEETCKVNRINLRPKLEDCGIWLRDAKAHWRKNQQEPTLNNISVTVTPGKLLAVVGPVGCGKSSLLMSILGELPVTSGEVRVRGKVAYSSQEPWSFAGSVRQNVLFGSDYDEEKYKQVLHVCALEKDITLLPYGDQTLVGERGVSLSGGQKARVNLARALYFDSDIYLLDDPLSAVDAAVAKHIFEKCIRGYLRNKIVILVTHQLQFVKNADQILVMRDGNCEALGNYHQLLNLGIDFVAIQEQMEEKAELRRLSESRSSMRRRSTSASSVNYQPPSGGMYESQTSVNSSVGGEGEGYVAIEGEKVPVPQEEMRTIGSVKGALYWHYVRAGAGWLLLTVIILSNLITQSLFNGSDVWLSLWTNHLICQDECESFMTKQSLENLTTTVIPDLSTITIPNTTTLNVTAPKCPKECSSKFPGFNDSLIIYSGLVAALFFFSLIRTTAFFFMCTRSSVNLHNRIFSKIIRAPMAFFDNNPVGVLLNRCSRDLGIIDDLLPPTAFDTIEIFINLFGILIVVSVITYYVVPPTIILAIIFVFIRRFYIRTARTLKRLEGTTRSPVFSHMSTTLYGLTTIRAFGAEHPFEKKFDHYQDEHTASWFLFISCTRWFGIVLDWLCAVYVIAVTIALMVLSESSFPAGAGGDVGLAIANAIMLGGMFQWGVRQSTELESHMTSVERILEYTNLPSEAALETPPDRKPPPNWPQKGEIVFEDVSLKYSKDEPPVLKNLNCHVKPQEKVGIVGRTGAGKSSLISTLFRMTEPEGTIWIDGVATNQLGLHDLRREISIIPQDPVLFTGPVWKNLDPFDEHTDDRLWEVLEEVRLKEAVQELPFGLNTLLAEGGGNFSVGQRQLVCLARAILRQNRILVLDEATANVDPSTDALIQQTIREKFKHCTVLTIAHRLNTIMDSDRVMVLDAGEIKEFDEPYILLQDPHTIFSQMVKMTGRAMAELLRTIAKQTYKKRHPETDGSPVHNKKEVTVEVLPPPFQRKGDRDSMGKGRKPGGFVPALPPYIEDILNENTEVTEL